mgnify:CR=1 FL=1
MSKPRKTLSPDQVKTKEDAVNLDLKQDLSKYTVESLLECVKHLKTENAILQANQSRLSSKIKAFEAQISKHQKTLKEAEKTKIELLTKCTQQSVEL